MTSLNDSVDIIRGSIFFFCLSARRVRVWLIWLSNERHATDALWMCAADSNWREATGDRMGSADR